ncbi:MAG TPA: hypothetical protein PLS28_02190, partial [Clostridiales bacterium]|nr:hypothetical protein [Clostridiales bacterium]
RTNEDLSFSGLSATLGWKESPEDFEATAKKKDRFYTAVDSSGFAFYPSKKEPAFSSDEEEGEL